MKQTVASIALAALSVSCLAEALAQQQPSYADDATVSEPAASLIQAEKADTKLPTFQYRYRRELIPAARADEPKIAFSPLLLRTHLDRGASLWSQQKKCFSCHTHGIYTLARLAAVSSWGEPPSDLRAFVVSQANETGEGRAENFSAPVRMAYIARALAAWDSRFSEETSPETDAALRQLLDLQSGNGRIGDKNRFPPINSSTYHGTIAAAMAVADAPNWLSRLDDQKLRTKVDKLFTYLRQMPPKNDHQRLLLLWASTRVPELIEPDERQRLIEMICGHQRSDGGWSVCSFSSVADLGGGKRAAVLETDEEYQNPKSDGYQTGLAIVVLRDAGLPATDSRIEAGVRWLLSNQRESGRLWTRSLNRQSRFHYIAYSGTAYAAWALARCDALE